jgi:dephospho-CoA kinase
MIIGLSGTLAAGKDTVAEYLVESEGFDHISLSAVLRKLATEKGIEITMENLTDFGNSLKVKFSADYLVERAKKEANFSRNIVVSSIRQPEEIMNLKREKDFFMIFVDADIKIRFERLAKRGRQGDVKEFKKFEEQEEKQLDGQSGGMNLGRCREIADYIILNNGTMDKFKGEIKRTIQQIKEKVGAKSENI